MPLFTGFSLTFLAGITMGFSLWSIKWARVWKWENFWLVYVIVSLIIVPFVIAFLMLPHLALVYASLTPREAMLPFVLGAFWGFAQLGAGICVHRLGFAVSGAVLNGVGAAVGTLVPLIILHREVLLQKSGLLIFFGMAVTLGGVTLCGWGGYRREELAKSQGRGAGFSTTESAMAQTASTHKGYLISLAIAFGSGVLSALLNIALAYSSGIMDKVRAHGGQASWAPFAVWPIALLGASLVNLSYSVYLLFKNKSWGRFGEKLSEIGNPALAGIMWMGAIALYSSATTYLGTLGISIGFALFTITMILSGQLVAVVTGEWRLMQRSIYRSFFLGIGLLVLAVLAIGAANYYQS
jgi:L-rhamnose-H+ transport protein